MHLLSSVLLSLGLAAFVSARPYVFDAGEEVDFSATLPESGQLVFTPLEFGLDESFDYDAFAEDNTNEAILEDWKQMVVRTHNEYRRKYGAGPLSWSDNLYPGTQQWANQCKFQHSNGGGKYGENLAAGTGNAYGYANGLKAWMDEAAKYDYNHPGFSSGTGHFTQVVWKSSKQVACALANCRGGTIFQQPSKYLVCRYDPPGNFIGRFPENVGRPQK